MDNVKWRGNELGSLRDVFAVANTVPGNDLRRHITTFVLCDLPANHAFHTTPRHLRASKWPSYLSSSYRATLSVVMPPPACLPVCRYSILFLI